MVVTRSQVDDAVKQVIVRVKAKLVLVVLVRHVVDVVGLGGVPGLWAKEATQRVCDTFHLFKDSVLHLAVVQDGAVGWTGLEFVYLFHESF